VIELLDRPVEQVGDMRAPRQLSLAK